MQVFICGACPHWCAHSCVHYHWRVGACWPSRGQPWKTPKKKKNHKNRIYSNKKINNKSPNHKSPSHTNHYQVLSVERAATALHQRINLCAVTYLAAVGQYLLHNAWCLEYNYCVHYAVPQQQSGLSHERRVISAYFLSMLPKNQNGSDQVPLLSCSYIKYQ